MKVFFSYASEDKAIVEQIFLRVCSKFPNIEGWLDKYEIVGGDDLIEKIHEGIESADKFLIFLSPNSIDKPWVRAELRKALMSEIEGIKPEFIVPVKIGTISQFPPFLESKYYIDIESKTQEEWLQDIHAAITREKKSPDKPTDNLLVSAHIASDNPKAVIVVFEAQFWAEQIGFKVTVSEDIKSTMWSLPSLKGMQQVSISKLERDKEYGVRIFDKSIRPKIPFIMRIEFADPGDPRKKVVSVDDRWDGSDGEQSMSFIHFR